MLGFSFLLVWWISSFHSVGARFLFFSSKFSSRALDPAFVSPILWSPEFSQQNCSKTISTSKALWNQVPTAFKQPPSHLFSFSRISVGAISWCLPLQPWQAARQPEDMAHLCLAIPQAVAWVAKFMPHSYPVLRAYFSTQHRTLASDLLHLGCYIHLKWLDYSLYFREISQVTRAGGAGPLTSMKTW